MVSIHVLLDLRVRQPCSSQSFQPPKLWLTSTSTNPNPGWWGAKGFRGRKSSGKMVWFCSSLCKLMPALLTLTGYLSSCVVCPWCCPPINGLPRILDGLWTSSPQARMCCPPTSLVLQYVNEFPWLLVLFYFVCCFVCFVPIIQQYSVEWFMNYDYPFAFFG